MTGVDEAAVGGSVPSRTSSPPIAAGNPAGSQISSTACSGLTAGAGGTGRRHHRSGGLRLIDGCAP
ncbi:hypothetical protein ACQEVB_18640 [Pseudonocardia sp. CA-107938]|uniref:hypothetical protein n=1 Tax=Pseudonocardia sp. CA-107938 TaxID=3240021 RepID=UPI003D8A3D7C